ncbi:MAG TPA: STAS domain-containing protein [Rectinemataceae bacterium]|nr:STAS domain-containing protein [Rectinemataceae bacterium]
MSTQKETVLQFERRGPILVVRVQGSIELFSVENLRRQIDAAVGSAPTDALVVSFAEVTLVDSTGLGLFIGLQKRLPEDCRMRLCEMSPSVRAMFEYARIFSRFEVDDSLAAALAALGATP